MPQGTTDFIGNTYWNANWGGSVDDVSFTEALLNELSSSYNVNQEKVYSTGMSNGGYFSYYLACNLSNRIAAIASVTGAMTKGTPATCSPQHATPVMEIHGDADGTVPYNGGALNESTQDGLDYWINYNNANTTPIFSAVPNINTSDNCTAEHYVYKNGNNCVEVEHYKILNGGHTWPGAPINIGSGATNHDINASLLIWEFFLKYDIHGKINCVPTAVNEIAKNEFNIYPNPAQSSLKLNYYSQSSNVTIDLLNYSGAVEARFLKELTAGNTEIVIPIDGLEAGMYIIRINDKNKFSYGKVIIR